MIQICRKDKEKVFEAIRTGKIDAAEMSFPNLIDDIILMMKKRGLTDRLAQALPDKRRDNSHIPFDILLCLAVAAKLKCRTSLTDVPFAVTEAELLAELGWNIWDNERNVNEGLFSESVMRKLLAKYKSGEWVSFYNSYVQEHLMPELNIQPCVHILDCTKVLVNLDNGNYENSSVVKIDGETMRGYKLGVLRGILDVTGNNQLFKDRTQGRHLHSCQGEHDSLSGCRKTGRCKREMAETSQPKTQRPGNPAGDRPGPVMGKRRAGKGCPHQCLCRA